MERLLCKIRKAAKDIRERSFQKDISMQNAKLPPHSNAKQNGIDEFVLCAKVPHKKIVSFICSALLCLHVSVCTENVSTFIRVHFCQLVH